MRYLLDTNVCIEIIRGRYPAVREKMAALAYGEAVICSIVWAELLAGARLSTQGYERARSQIDAFSLLPQLPFDRTSAEQYAELRAHLQRQGQLIGGNDLQIAAIALAHGLTVVTHNTREFSRISNLLIEDWQS